MQKVTTKNIGGEVIKEDDRYTVIDNRFGKTLVLSSTFLTAGKSTTGHSHAGQEEVYIFTSGRGSMLVDTETYDVKMGDIVLIPDGAFHKVWNTGDEIYDGDLVFTCVFDGGRNH